MGIRESLNQKPALTTGITATIIGAAILYIIWQAVVGPAQSASGPRTAFYTFDDGQTWFVDDISKAAPFIKDGREAVRVHLYSSDGGKTKVPLYMEKFTDRGLKIYHTARADERDIAVMASASVRLERELLIKRPGEEKWYARPNYDVGPVFAKEKFKDVPDGANATEVIPD